MPQCYLRSSLLSLGLALSLASCASAPPGPTAKTESPTPKASEIRTVNLLCHEGARALRFDKAGRTLPIYLENAAHPFQPGPRTTRPAAAPVGSPSLRTWTPLTKTCRTPVAYWCGLS